MERIFKQIWSEFDKDGNGEINKDELKFFLQRAFQISGIDYEISDEELVEFCN